MCSVPEESSQEMAMKGGQPDDGGSAHAASSADTLSSDISSFVNQAERNRLPRFPAAASQSDEKLRP